PCFHSLRSFSCSGCGDLLAPPSFPTRRSSDLRNDDVDCGGCHGRGGFWLRLGLVPGDALMSHGLKTSGSVWAQHWSKLWPGCGRSEEHTSELQSRFDLVCRLLLEKKNHDEDTY